MEEKIIRFCAEALDYEYYSLKGLIDYVEDEFGVKNTKNHIKAIQGVWEEFN